MIDFLSFFSIWSVLLPTAAGMLFFKKLTPTGKIITLTCLLAVFPQFIRYFTQSASGMAIFYNGYTLVEVVLFAIFFKTVTPAEGKNKLHILTFACMAVLAAIILYHVFSVGFDVRFFPEWVCMANLYYTMAAMLLIYTILYQNKDWHLHPENNLYLAGIFLYAPITTAIFSNWLFLKKTTDSVLKSLWVIHHIANILLYLLFFSGILLAIFYHPEKNNRLWAWKRATLFFLLLLLPCYWLYS